MTDAPTQVASSPAAATPADPLARLHHMSTTAGITAQEYVAINVASVVAALLGMISLVVLIFQQPVLLVIPAAAVVFGVASLTQIRNSNGTQWGRPLAWTGIVLAVLLGGGQVAKAVIQARAQQNDEQQVSQLISLLGEHVARGEDSAAYALFTDRFRERFTAEAFGSKWDLVRKNVAPVKAIRWNGVRMMFQEDGSGTLHGIAMAKLEFTSATSTDGRQQLNVRKGPAGWQIDAIPLLFGEERKRSGGGTTPAGTL